MIRKRVTTVVRTVRERPALLAALVLLLAVLAGLTGYWLASGDGQTAAESSGRRILYWYDPMLPDERYPGPGKS